MPGEFHEDRWPRTAEYSERCVLPRTREAGPIGYKLSRGEGGFWTVFGTVTPPTGISVASPRGEGVIYGHFGTATLPTGTSEPSPRGEGGFIFPAIEPFARQKGHPGHQPKPSCRSGGSSRPLKGSFCPSGESFCPSGWSFCQHIHAEGGIFGNGI